jgi:hypothetical protein
MPHSPARRNGPMSGPTSPPRLGSYERQPLPTSSKMRNHGLWYSTSQSATPVDTSQPPLTNHHIGSGLPSRLNASDVLMRTRRTPRIVEVEACPLPPKRSAKWVGHPGQLQLRHSSQ